MSTANLCDHFVSNACEWPERPALEIGEDSYSYGDLDEWSKKIATCLFDAGLKAGERVAVMAYRGLACYAGCLGILRSGGTYVPMNPSFPAKRTARMLASCGARCVILGPSHLDSFGPVLANSDNPLTVLVLTREEEDALKERWPLHRVVATTSVSDDLTKPATTDSDLAYIMFTSGTTGEPKSVGVTHLNAVTYVDSLLERFPFAPEDRCSQMFDPTFDPSMHDLFVTWGAGSCLCVVPEKQLMLPAKFIRDKKLTCWYSVPSAASMLNRMSILRPDAFPMLRYSAFSGEALPGALAEAWQAAAPNSVIENLYGPTEATINCTAYRWNKDESEIQTKSKLVPIGHPLPGQSALVVDEQMKPVKEGEMGELWVGGTQVAPGYLDNPGQTSSKFVELDVGEDLPKRWYRTGDLVRFYESVGLVFFGRADSQVKITGHRVELSEIEEELRAAAKVDFAIAIPWPVTPEGYGGVVAFLDKKLDMSIDEIRRALAEQLPAYMVPSRIVELERFPLNPNGKIDRNALKRGLEDQQWG